MQITLYVLAYLLVGFIIGSLGTIYFYQQKNVQYPGYGEGGLFVILVITYPLFFSVLILITSIELACKYSSKWVEYLVEKK